jgi:tetratricopeptide (TPR) repeat protein
MDFFRRGTAIIASALLLTLSLTGCESGFSLKSTPMTKLSIPDLNNAQEQFTYAVRYQQNTFPAGKPELRKDQRNQFRQLYQRVVDRYPNDQTHTPLARMILADLNREDGKLNDALKSYRQLQSDYPSMTFVKVRAMYSEADILDRQKKFDEAKQIHRRIMTEYENSTVQGVPPIVARARELYLTVRKDTPVRKRDDRPTRGELRL